MDMTHAEQMVMLAGLLVSCALIFVVPLWVNSPRGAKKGSDQ